MTSFGYYGNKNRRGINLSLKTLNMEGIKEQPKEVKDQKCEWLLNLSPSCYLDVCLLEAG
jgi:hypothetical protein